MGIYENVSFDAVDWKEFWSIHSESKYLKLESMKSVYKRVSQFLDTLKQEENIENVLLVTHGGVMRTIQWYFYGVDSQIFQCANCRIYEYTLK